jgi:hypothetical protein
LDVWNLTLPNDSRELDRQNTSRSCIKRTKLNIVIATANCFTGTFRFRFIIKSRFFFPFCNFSNQSPIPRKDSLSPLKKSNHFYGSFISRQKEFFRGFIFLPKLNLWPVLFVESYNGAFSVVVIVKACKGREIISVWHSSLKIVF